MVKMIPLYREWLVNEVHINFFSNTAYYTIAEPAARAANPNTYQKLVVITISHLAEKIWFIMEFSTPKTSRKTVVLW